ncbi:MAG: hypothetical protein M1823_002860 [Watsoniomyces obsoletus]|nr:MAG: hypothetical protein M1823_002860 [Watsoniomyces obsoletus]
MTITITIHEPSITEDNLGFKTWAASYMLANRLWKLRKYLSRLNEQDANDSSPNVGEKTQGQEQRGIMKRKKKKRKLRVLELGAGTGLLGLAAAVAWNAHVHMTDMASIVPNIKYNVSLNEDLLDRSGEQSHKYPKGDQDDGLEEEEDNEDKVEISSGVLSWEDFSSTDDTKSTRTEREERYINKSINTEDIHTRKYEVILTADTLYDPSQPRKLVDVIQHFLPHPHPHPHHPHHPHSTKGMIVMISIPLRRGYEREKHEFETRMRDIGFRILDQGAEMGVDDWGDHSSSSLISSPQMEGEDQIGGMGEGEEMISHENKTKDEQYDDGTMFETERTDGGEEGGVRCWWSVWEWEFESNSRALR